jgi:hypothetical protein
MAAEDWIPEFWHYKDYDLDFPEPYHYLDLSDEELFKQTSHTRTEKLKSIREFYKKRGYFSPKQKYCLACWLADNESKYI